jgi:hypothetical protein
MEEQSFKNMEIRKQIELAAIVAFAVAITPTLPADEPAAAADRLRGAQMAKIQELVRNWDTDYDSRKLEARHNVLPRFVAAIDEPDGRRPGSSMEPVKVIAPLTGLMAYDRRAENTFDVVFPSIPGYGFSGRPTANTGWNPDHIARAWVELMVRLGCKRYVTQGGDWDSVVTDVMARQKSPGLPGVHVNMTAKD